MQPIYLDNQATTRCDPRVVETMLPLFTEHFGNPASTAHPYGWKARETVEFARSQVANLAGAEAEEVVFTSGATEAINLSLKGIARNRPWSEIHIVTCVTEHSAVLDTCDYLQSCGARITKLPVDGAGHIDLDQLESVISKGASLCTLMHANNEIGVIHPIEQIAAICNSHNVPLHVDAAQSIGKIPVKVRDWQIDLLSLSGHKLYAPKGIGALIIRRQNPPMRLTPLLHGGGHERGFRSGTQNVPGITALGKAAEICSAELEPESERAVTLRTLLLKRLQSGIPDLRVNGCLKHRLPGNLNISIPGIDGQLLLPALRETVSVSSGSACTSAQPKPSYVLDALGVSPELAFASLRFGIGRFNSEHDIIVAADAVISVVQKLTLHKQK